MKKFSKITENKQFLGWSIDKIRSEFSTLNPTELDVEMLGYVFKDREGSEVWDAEMRSDSIHRQDDDSLSPMFIVYLSLGEIPTGNNFHEVNGKQVENWVYESINFDLVNNEFQKLSSFLSKYKDDFFISVESSGGKWGNKERVLPNVICGKYLISVVISLIMKDSFEYDQIK